MIFSTPELVAWDSMRIVAGVAALFVAGAMPFILHRTLNWHQRFRFIGSGLLAVAIIGNNLQRLGTIPEQWGWRVVLITVGMILFAVGSVAYLHDQGPEPPRRHRR